MSDAAPSACLVILDGWGMGSADESNPIHVVNPQNINYTNYWLETVSTKSKHQAEAWDFIQFATKAEQAKLYLAKVKTPTALRSLVNEQLDDMQIGVFAEQVLTAKSWYRGMDSAAAEQIFAEMIDNAVNGSDTLDNLINLAARKVQQTVTPPTN